MPSDASKWAFVAAPAPQRLIRLQAAGVSIAAANGGERTHGRSGLAKPVASPAHHGGIWFDGAPVLPSNGNRYERAVGWCRLTDLVLAPTRERSIRFDSTRVEVGRAQRRAFRGASAGGALTAIGA